MPFVRGEGGGDDISGSTDHLSFVAKDPRHTKPKSRPDLLRLRAREARGAHIKMCMLRMSRRLPRDFGRNRSSRMRRRLVF